MKSLEYSINPLVTQIEKEPKDFTRKDIIDFISGMTSVLSISGMLPPTAD